MSIVCFIGCSKRKLPGRHRAEDLYASSDLFRKSKRYAQLYSDKWFILSAKHGVLHPGDVIDSYDSVLSLAPDARWQAKVSIELSKILERGDVAIFITAERYLPALHVLGRLGVKMVEPLANMRNGKRLQWLQERISERS